MVLTLSADAKSDTERFSHSSPSPLKASTRTTSNGCFPPSRMEHTPPTSSHPSHDVSEQSIGHYARAAPTYLFWEDPKLYLLVYVTKSGVWMTPPGCCDI